jgi:hypothetical protein
MISPENNTLILKEEEEPFGTLQTDRTGRTKKSTKKYNNNKNKQEDPDSIFRFCF